MNPKYLYLQYRTLTILLLHLNNKISQYYRNFSGLQCLKSGFLFRRIFLSEILHQLLYQSPVICEELRVVQTCFHWIFGKFLIFLKDTVKVNTIMGNWFFIRGFDLFTTSRVVSLTSYGTLPSSDKHLGSEKGFFMDKIFSFGFLNFKFI